MASPAFALSPISARATLPSDEDYAAIREAFMETARGRWFLDEYTRRNRNSDTSMVLDAVSRIEETLAAQRQPPPPPPEDKRAELLSAIKSAVDEAEQTASAALEGLKIEENLVPIRKGARIIKEIAWRWREIGADGRICDLLDSQVGAIEGGCDVIAEVDPRVALREAFSIIQASISAFSDIAEPAPAPAVEQAVVAPEAEVDEPLAADVSAEPEPDDAEPYDEAMLDRVAIEMAALDEDETDAEFAVAEPEAQLDEPLLDESVLASSVPEPAFVEEPAPPSPPAAPEPAPSLGATILANGLVARPKPPANDPLAPIRRMSQAEKIAFFS
jgi:hypothetical protein